MSASEKLKALDGREMVRLDPPKYLAGEQPGVIPDELYAALPQIVAVVEAAEAAYEYIDTEEPRPEILAVLATALSALNEALK